jgi:ribosomal protein S18 acetylase RimI-like enzyme
MSITVTPAADGDAADLANLAAATFPLACPDSVAAEDIAAFIAANLTAERFGEYLADPDRAVLAARAEGRIVGYALLVRGHDIVELSKIYVLAAHHGTDAAAALMLSAIDWASDTGAATIWLGVNQNNARAQRFYLKHGFEITGTRTFQLGGNTQADFLMSRPL